MPEEVPGSAIALVELSAANVSAYVGHNSLSPTDLPKLIPDIHFALKSLESDPVAITEPSQEPAISIRRSVTKGAIVCLEDGPSFKSLKRHLRVHHQMTPEQYREKWQLPVSYPMVAPEYSARRSRLAKEIGFGRDSVVKRTGKGGRTPKS
ncbi:MAG: MucR family transcriptional regulator [Devosia sp.]